MSFSPVLASDEYPRSCSYAKAASDSARQHSDYSPILGWDPRKLEIARYEYFACITAAADTTDLGFAVTGLVRTDFNLSLFYATHAQVYQRSLSMNRVKLFNANMMLALSYLIDAKNSLDIAISHSEQFDTKGLQMIDRLYEYYKARLPEVRDLQPPSTGSILQG